MAMRKILSALKTRYELVSQSTDVSARRNEPPLIRMQSRPLNCSVATCVCVGVCVCARVCWEEKFCAQRLMVKDVERLGRNEGSLPTGFT